jgi:NTP pyrophosphatase (non-canonical NTP hydrolase)
MRPRAKSIDDLQREVVRIYAEYEATGTNRWTHQTALIDLQYQIGALAKCVLQLQGDRFNEGKSIGELRASIGDELADILAEVLFIAHELNVDLVKAWSNMLETDENKIASRSDFRGKQAS